MTFKAGAGALESVRKHGFDVSSIGTMAGASGGAKWLVLSKLDRAIHACIVPRLEGPVHLIGSSIGSWRFACYAQADPVAAIERFEQAYLEQSYSDKPDVDEITARSREILAIVLGEHGIEEILANPLFRLHVLAVRSRAVMASENRALLGTALLTAALLNVASRATLGWFFERALFYDRRDRPPFFQLDGFPLQRIELTRQNVEDAIAASGSIPLVLSGVRGIEGAARGVYRDGGIVDYHLDLPHSAHEKFTLYPHFYGRIVPGWFDKKLGWRKPQPHHIDRTILVSPSDEFVARLPHGKIPDRQDFVNFAPAERVRAWRQCVAACDALADEFLEVVEKEQLAARLEPL
ncbi:MAG: patatin-like phospholipase family protein [Gammaproteobacteria bacterium]|nr:patatin-like phospholipase family protein [Gammaproteobacteria bacterium]NNF50257.1 patatin-like phospholipase family protein [Woeseiaceae bacterium]MBT8095219.1 patatin-like phospholipase family protein [Gammaproteobacteria bacterium]MBT8105628.1 patatin-like phospholipase family protein [Gammaproteobacteria bacterium]NNK25642.1 patatin-like phospholipase family protein [Woeseiaceae bacterium]